MKTSEISTYKNNSQKNILKSGMILAGSTAIIPSAFLVIDNFSNNKKNYLKSVQNEKDIFEKTVEQNTQVGIGLLKKLNKPIDDSSIEIIRNKVILTEQLKLDEKLEQLKRLRQTHINKGLKISAGIGLSIGAAILAIKNIYSKQKNQSVQQKSTNNKIPSDNIPFGNKIEQNQISFTGIVDKIASGCSPQEIKILQDFVNGINPTTKEINLAQKIAKYRVKDWPKGILDSFTAKYHKPYNDKEYHTILLKQEIVVPPEPPVYYRKYDRTFNTKRWQEFQKWPEYIDKASKYERMESIINQERIKSYALEKSLIEQAAKKELSSACTKYKIYDEFLSSFNANNKIAQIPNAIMIQSKNAKDAEETIKWIVAKVDSNFLHIESKDAQVKQIFSALENAEKYYNKNQKRTLIWIDDFDKLLSKNSGDEETIGDLKNILDKISNQYKATIVFSCKNTEMIDPIALQPHRVKKYNLDMEAPLENLQKIHASYISSNIKEMKNSDGYRFKYIPYEEKYVDLYLGDFSYRPDILWVDSQDADAIAAVIKYFDIIKTKPKFKDIKTIRFAEPNKIEKLDYNKMKYTGKLTMNHKVIYEYTV